MLSPRIIESTAVFTVAIVEEAVVLVWKQPPNLAGIEQCTSVFRSLRAQKKRFAMFVVVDERAGLEMPKEVRAALGELLKEYQKDLLASVVVFEGSGFRASIVRSVVATIALVNRLEFPSTVEAKTLDGATWLIKHCGDKTALTAPGMVTALQTMR